MGISPKQTMSDESKYLDKRIVPAIAYQDRFQTYLVCPSNVLGILALDESIEDGPIVSSIALLIAFSVVIYSEGTAVTNLWRSESSPSSTAGKPP